MHYIIGQDFLEYLYNYFSNERSIIDIDFNDENKTKEEETLYLSLIDELKKYEFKITKILENKINNTNIDEMININEMINREINIVEIERFIFDDTLMFYLSEYKILFSINRYVRVSEVREYIMLDKSTINQGINRSIPNNITSSKILSYITYDNIRAFFTNPNLLNIDLAQIKYNNVRSIMKPNNVLEIDLRIKHLTLQYKIDSIDHINTFSDLEELELYVSPNEVKGELILPKLRILSLWENNIIPNLKHLPLLESLFMRNKKLSLDMNSLKSNLTTIILTRCELQVFDIHIPETLKILILSNNELKTFKLVSLNNLTTLNISYNKISKLELIELKNLISLDLSHNRLTSITLGGEIDQIPFKYMKYLRLNNNELSEVKFLDVSEIDKQHKIQYVNLSRNRLTSIESMFDYMPYITDLNIANNYLNLFKVKFPKYIKNVKYIDSFY